jgi:hypothetical protein
VIDESVRKKALFFPLQKHFVGLLGSLGYDFSYGLMTRPPVLKPHLAVGWKKIGELKVFARPVAAGRIVSKLFPKLGFQKTFDYLSRPFQWLFDALTVAENIALAMPGAFDMKKLSERITRVSRDYGLPLEPFAVVADLSVGERQRIEIVRCLLQEPKLLIMDEPTAVLTPQERAANCSMCLCVSRAKSETLVLDL